jgi:hypothetical protein
MTRPLTIDVCERQRSAQARLGLSNGAQSAHTLPAERHVPQNTVRIMHTVGTTVAATMCPSS